MLARTGDIRVWHFSVNLALYALYVAVMLFT
jgi:hypothetical protein